MYLRAFAIVISFGCINMSALAEQTVKQAPISQESDYWDGQLEAAQKWVTLKVFAGAFKIDQEASDSLSGTRNRHFYEIKAPAGYTVCSASIKDYQSDKQASIASITVHLSAPSNADTSYIVDATATGGTVYDRFGSNAAATVLVVTVPSEYFAPDPDQFRAENNSVGYKPTTDKVLCTQNSPSGALKQFGSFQPQSVPSTLWGDLDYPLINTVAAKIDGRTQECLGVKHRYESAKTENEAACKESGSPFCDPEKKTLKGLYSEGVHSLCKWPKALYPNGP
jgi:hypothetical protein